MMDASSQEALMWSAGGGMGVLAFVKGLSAVVRSWRSDRTTDKADVAASNQLAALEKENHALRAENGRLREDWAKMVREEANLTARIVSFEDTMRLQSAQIEYLTKLTQHYMKESGLPFPAELLMPAFGPKKSNGAGND